MSTQQEFAKVEDKVRKALKDNIRARNDDDFLIWYIKHHIECKDLNRFCEYKESSNAETIRRNRAHIQNDKGEYLPTKRRVIKKRQLKRSQVRDYFGSKKADKVFGADGEG
jgi:hypothetical protein